MLLGSLVVKNDMCFTLREIVEWVANTRISLFWLAYTSHRLCKFFMYVTKTCANLATYSNVCLIKIRSKHSSNILLSLLRFYMRQMLENWRITMASLFLRLISWKTHPQSIQIFVKLDFYTTFLVVSFVLIYHYWQWSWAESAVSPAEKKCHFGFDIGKKCEFWIEWGWVFHDVHLKNNGAIVIPSFFTICG